MTVLRHDLSFSASELGLGVYEVCDAAREESLDAGSAVG